METGASDVDSGTSKNDDADLKSVKYSAMMSFLEDLQHRRRLVILT